MTASEAGGPPLCNPVPYESSKLQIKVFHDLGPKKDRFYALLFPKCKNLADDRHD